MNNCPTCYQHTIASCTKTIHIVRGLSPTTTYTVTITDKFGSVFVTSANSNINGGIQINTDDFPPYLLNPYAGDVTIHFYSSCGAADLTFCEVMYTCIQLHIVEVTGDDGSGNIAQLPCCPGELQQDDSGLFN